MFEDKLGQTTKAIRIMDASETAVVGLFRESHNITSCRNESYPTYVKTGAKIQ